MPSSSLPPHGGYRNLKSFQAAEIVFDFTMELCKKYIDRTHGTNRTYDQMVQAARSGKQNIIEGSQTSAVSPRNEIMLTNVARASLEELKADYEDFLRVNRLPRWAKDDPRALAVRKMAYRSNRSNRSYTSYKSYMSHLEPAANCALCLINQANYLLDQQLRGLVKKMNRTDGTYRTYGTYGGRYETREQRIRRIREQERERTREFDEAAERAMAEAVRKDREKGQY